MRRWGPIFALLVSVGLNVGILAMLAIEKLRPEPVRPVQTAPTVDQGVEPAEPPASSVAEPSAEPDPQPPSNGSRVDPPANPPARSPVDPQPRTAPPPSPSESPRTSSTTNPPTPASATTVSAEPLVIPRGGPPRERLEQLADRLAVTGAARVRFLELHHRMFRETSASRFELQRLRRAVQLELLADTPDRTRIESLLAQVAQRQAELDRRTFAAILEARELLPASSRRMYVEFIGRIRFGAGEAAVPPKARPRLNQPLPRDPNGGVPLNDRRPPDFRPGLGPNDRRQNLDPRADPALRQEMMRRRRERLERLERRRELLDAQPPPIDSGLDPEPIEGAPPPPPKGS